MRGATLLSVEELLPLAGGTNGKCSVCGLIMPPPALALQPQLPRDAAPAQALVQLLSGLPVCQLAQVRAALRRVNSSTSF